MKHIIIFVEGIADYKFLTDYLSFVSNEKLNNTNNIDIIKTGGWLKLSSENNEGEAIRNSMEKNTDNDGINLVIFDADDNYKQRKKELLSWQKTFDLQFELFLLPDNESNGDLENLLESIITPINQPIMECWKKYEHCLSLQQIEGRDSPLTLPARKTKIYGYLEALLGSSKSQKEKIKERERDYLNKQHWDLSSPSLLSLKHFIEQYI